MTNSAAWSAGSAIALLAAVLSGPAAAQDARAIYADTCARCHGLLDEQTSWLQFLPENGAEAEIAVVLPQGPTLNGVFGRPVGMIEGYKYSKGMRAFAETGAVWDRPTLDAFLTNSRKFVKGTFMILKLRDDQRVAILDYLEKVARHKVQG